MASYLEAQGREEQAHEFLASGFLEKQESAERRD